MVVALIAMSCKKEHIPSPIPTPPTPKALYLKKADSLAVIEIYAQMNGKANLPSWDLKDWKTWVHLTTTAVEGTDTVVITGANLYCGYNGTISDRIGDLVSLTSLYISGKGFFGAVPSTISNLKNLHSLSISRTNLTILPNDAFGSDNYTSIDIYDNEFKGSLPSSMYTLSGVKSININLSKNKFSGAVPIILSIPKPGIRKTFILLDDNNLTEIPFEYLTEENLAGISARRNRFSGELPQNIVDAIAQEPNGYVANHYRSTFWNEFQEGYGFTNAPEVNP